VYVFTWLCLAEQGKLFRFDLPLEWLVQVDDDDFLELILWIDCGWLGCPLVGWIFGRAVWLLRGGAGKRLPGKAFLVLALGFWWKGKGGEERGKRWEISERKRERDGSKF
jgi:hypothetical protein